APFTQSLIVLRPVSYLLFCLTHATTALTIIKGQIARLEKGSTDLGNNADLDSFGGKQLNYIFEHFYFQFVQVDWTWPWCRVLIQRFNLFCILHYV
ncbi:hypothetical protein, partial [Vibrio sp. M260112]|uniref:hypothetical protein n=1 Tax=Vibrio sp. M260112 TaxID=3020895 RepID=UPI002F41B04D